MSLSLKDRLVYNIRSNKMKLRPEQTVKNKLLSSVVLDSTLTPDINNTPAKK